MIEPATTPRRWSSLGTRLFALVLLALAIQGYNEMKLKRSREAEVRTDAPRLAKFAVGELDRIIDNGRTLAVALAPLSGGAKPRC